MIAKYVILTISGILFLLSIACRHEVTEQKKETPSNIPTKWIPLFMEIPNRVNDLLTRSYPGWALTDNYYIFDPIVEELHQKKYQCNPNYLQGDFDGNKLLDYAFEISYGDSAKKKNVYVVFLFDGEAYQEHVLDSGKYSTNTYLMLQKKGVKVHDYDADKDVTLKNDAITIFVGDEEATTYYFQEGKFEALLTGD